MNQNDYLKKLEAALKQIGVQRVDEILADYQEHFMFGLKGGKLETEICQNLGDPNMVAKAYETENMIKEIKNPEAKFSFSAALMILGRLILLAPFNFLILFIPGAILMAIIVSGWAVAVTFFAGSIAAVSATFAAGIINLSFWIGAAATAGSLSLLGISILTAFFMFFVSKHFVLGCISYLQWNLKFILQK